MAAAAPRGRVLDLGRGLFSFGLSVETNDARRNAEALMRSRVEIPIVCGNGAAGVIFVNKGVTGEQAFSEAFVDWSR